MFATTAVPDGHALAAGHRGPTSRRRTYILFAIIFRRARRGRERRRRRLKGPRAAERRPPFRHGNKRNERRSDRRQPDTSSTSSTELDDDFDEEYRAADTILCAGAEEFHAYRLRFVTFPIPFAPGAHRSIQIACKSQHRQVVYQNNSSRQPAHFVLLHSTDCQMDIKGVF